MYLNRFSINKKNKFDKFYAIFLIWYKQDNISWSSESIASLKQGPNRLHPNLEKMFFEKFENLYEDLSNNVGETFILFPPVKKGCQIPLNWFYKLLIRNEKYRGKILLVESENYNLKAASDWKERDKIIKSVSEKWKLRSSCNIEKVENILFVDDIFTRGTTISHLIDFLLIKGFKCIKNNYHQYNDIKNVFGLFLAKTESRNDKTRKWENENFLMEREISKTINENEKINIVFKCN